MQGNRERIWAVLALAAILTMGWRSSASAQDLGPRLYTILHTWGAASSTTGECRAMGGADLFG